MERRIRIREHGDVYLKKDYWLVSSDLYKRRYLRLEKCARIVDRLAGGREVDLLDIGCGPATLGTLVRPNVHYHGIDQALQEPSPNLIEMDLTQEQIRFRDQRFDLVVAGGLFEYLGEFHQQKLREIRALLKDDGKFIVTYTNFAHPRPPRHGEPTYNNVMSIPEFRASLERLFKVDRYFPSSHNWVRGEPRRRWLYALNMMFSIHVPLFSDRFANNYFFICSLG
jgi:cyclopropane fatty-acyl-phospholipid synthase-like methyltransferase